MWPAEVLRQFQTIPLNPTEIEFQGPYDKLLNILFPPGSNLVVVPRYLSDSRNAADFMVMSEVLLVDRPVMILQLKPPSHYNFQSKRQAVDDQIRVHMTDLAATCPLETIYAVSALGTRLCFYSLDTRYNNAEIVPTTIPRHPTRINDTPPATLWSYDILEAAGGEWFREMVEEITAGCAALV